MFVSFFMTMRILCPIESVTVPSLCSWKFWKIQHNFDPDGQLDSIAPEARSNPTARRGQNYLEFFKIFMDIGTELSTLSMGYSIELRLIWCVSFNANYRNFKIELPWTKDKDGNVEKATGTSFFCKTNHCNSVAPFQASLLALAFGLICAVLAML